MSISGKVRREYAGKPERGMNLIKSIGGALFILAAPLFLLTAGVTWAVNDAGLYDRGFAKYDISPLTGITGADLSRVGAELRHYFNSGEEPLAVSAPVFGLERELFNQREVDHMRDVKRLIWGTYATAALTGAYMLAVILAGFAAERRGFTPILSRWLLRGGLLTLAIVVAVGLFALVGFDSLFLLFHRISFANNLWQLDPRTDYLLIMFPLGFWFDATVRVALYAVTGAAALSALGGGYLFYRRRTPQPGRPTD